MCSIIPHYVLPVSRSNVLNYLDTRLARKGKEEMIRSSLEKSIDFASHRHISGHRLRSLSQWFWKQKQLARRPVFHPDLVKILLGRVRGGGCPSLFIFIRHLCWELLALRTSLRIWEESPLKWGCWVRGNSSEGPASPGAERPQVSVSRGDSGLLWTPRQLNKPLSFLHLSVWHDRKDLSLLKQASALEKQVPSVNNA